MKSVKGAEILENSEEAFCKMSKGKSVWPALQPPPHQPTSLDHSRPLSQKAGDPEIAVWITGLLALFQKLLLKTRQLTKDKHENE